MKAVILAAGVASRLRPLTDDTPKCLLKIGSKTILEQTIDNLHANGIGELIIVTGYLEDKIRTFVAEKYPELNVQFIHNSVYDTTNNIYSLWLTKDALNGQDMLLLDSDILFDKDIVKLLLVSSFENCLALKSGFQLGEEEIKVRLKKDNTIAEISKVVAINDAIGESIGIEKFSGFVLRKLFEELDRMITKENQVNVWYEAAFQNIIDAGAKIYPVDVGELVCMELDTHEDLERAATEVVPLLDKDNG